MALSTPVQPVSRPSCSDQRAVTRQLVQKIHYWIECCLIRHMNLAEAISFLEESYGIQRCLTEIVWHQLEVQNPEFFSVYAQKLSTQKIYPEA